MSLSPIPRGVYPSITDISPRALADRGIRLVLADLDNTLAPYKVTEPPAEAAAWKEALEAAGITLFLLSNGPGPELCRKAGHPLSGPFGQAQEGGLPQGHGADGLYPGADRHGGGPDFH